MKPATMIDRISKVFETNAIAPTNLQPMVGLPSSALSEWKRGKSQPSKEALVKIAEYFHVSLDWLVFGEDCDEYIRRPVNDKNWMKEHCDNPKMLAKISLYVPMPAPGEKLAATSPVEDLYNSLSDDDKKKAIAYMDALAGNTIPTGMKSFVPAPVVPEKLDHPKLIWF